MTIGRENVGTETETCQVWLCHKRSRPHVTRTGANVKRSFGRVIQQYLMIIVDEGRNHEEHRHLQESDDPQPILIH